jgi:hypothetical protein
MSARLRDRQLGKLPEQSDRVEVSPVEGDS